MARRTITQRYSIKCLTPIYIQGNEDSLLPINYVILDGICYVIDIERLITEKKELIVDFRSEIEKLKDKFELKGFLNKHDLLSTKFLESICTYRSKVTNEIEDHSVIYPLMKNPFNDPFIPSAVLYDSLAKSLLADRIKRYITSPNKVFLARRKSNSYRRYRKKIMGQIDRILSKVRRGNIKKWKDLDKIFFRQFKLKEKNKLLHKKENHNDIFRSVFITDTLI